MDLIGIEILMLGFVAWQENGGKCVDEEMSSISPRKLPSREAEDFPPVPTKPKPPVVPPWLDLGRVRRRRE